MGTFGVGVSIKNKMGKLKFFQSHLRNRHMWDFSGSNKGIWQNEQGRWKLTSKSDIWLEAPLSVLKHPSLLSQMGKKSFFLEFGQWTSVQMNMTDG